MSKEFSERSIQSWSERLPFSYTILKPSILIGTPENPGPIQGVTLVAKALMIMLKVVDRTVKGISSVAMLPTLEGVTRLKGVPESHLNVIPVDIVAEGIARSFLEKNRILYLTNPNPPTVQEVASEIGNAFGHRFVLQEEFKASIPERILQKETKPVQPYLTSDQHFPSILEDYYLEPGYIELLVRKSFL
jgi:nucleoside-diphosphate-sugar epimerase